MSKLVPIMKQYLNIKKKYKNILLFYQIGDFYELFYDDAIKISSLLNIKLTKKNFVNQINVPMSGIPICNSESYIFKLIKLGESVALCCQDNYDNKGDFVFNSNKLINRKVVRVITPGTVSEENFLDCNKDNYIASIWSKKNKEIFGYSCLDISSGRFYISEIYGLDKLKYDLLCTNPIEIIYPDNFFWFKYIKHIFCLKSFSVNEFDYKKSYESLLFHFGLKNLSCFNIKDDNLGIIPAGFLLNYVKSTQFLNLSHVNKIKLLNSSKIVFMDYFTIKNLELIDSISGNKKNTLFNVLNNTSTPMGNRMLRRWIIYPLNDFNELRYRHKIIDFIKCKFDLIKSLFKKIGDIERILGRISLRTVVSKDLINLKNYLNVILDFNKLFNFRCNLDIINYLKLSDFLIKNIIDLINISIVNDNDNFNEYNLILSGYNKDLDKLRKLNFLNKKKLFLLEKNEREKTGISNLFIKYSKIHGYYIQVSKSDVNLVPKKYIKYQVLKNCVRFILNDLKIYEANFLYYKRKIFFLEKKIFNKILDKIIFFINELKIISYNIAKLDVLLNFFDISFSLGYKKPIFYDNSILKIINGRHPILDRNINSFFIPNDLYLDNKNRCLIITGPNMGGKSTYMRQIALICIMALIGCYVSADKLLIGPIDKILTRIGFSDDIMSNKSTFMVEMNEIHNIINNSSYNSLILIDEMGRGTSFYEGISLAWSCLYYIVSSIKSMILFSTHFIELTRMSSLLSGIKNVYCDFFEKKDKFILLYKIKEGICYKSYGINLASKIGILKPIIDMSILKFKELLLSDIDKKFLVNNDFCFNKNHDYIFDIISNIDLDKISKKKLLNKVKKIRSIFFLKNEKW